MKVKRQGEGQSKRLKRSCTSKRALNGLVWVVGRHLSYGSQKDNNIMSHCAIQYSNISYCTAS